jgi:hypothetical protein
MKLNNTKMTNLIIIKPKYHIVKFTKNNSFFNKIIGCNIIGCNIIGCNIIGYNK